MLYPPVADLLKKVDSRYLLVNLVAHRARQIAAEAEATSIMKVQQALADAMRMLNENAPNDQVIKLKSLEALEKMADGKATKIIIPSEIQGLAGLAASAKALVENDPPQA